MSKLLGVVLCGGESRRMGQDKGLLQIDGQPWVLRMGEKLAHLQIPVVYSVNKKQVAAYAAWLPPGLYVVDSGAGAGPLKGLLSVHRAYPDCDLLPVACDMQDLDVDTISGLIPAWRKGGSDFYAYEVDGFLQPFCAIYGASALRRGESVSSLRGLLEKGELRRLPGTTPAFRNYNTL
ncbi:MAG TPA: molybdenum cofactor guanylyltransferase [Puia sp.]|uniref:molybdenum cofactor guanylyltransferase n=1 Tax=Puia sp. TaxID=2045100 RepID=UPI002B6BA321|nr:molybdenum cofactor guanylyltransferase [Puia sp.]HVU96677.1 molybdenum cofactor guanylyltransferase [Puia sp.]